MGADPDAPARGILRLMPELHERLAERVRDWRAAGYPSDRPAIAEILEHAVEGEEGGRPFPASGWLGYLRAPQLRALETYWYLRLVEGTPHIEDLYASLYPKDGERLDALGLGGDFARIALDEGGVDALLRRVRSDDAFAAGHRLDALRETLSLDYPSYILALAMGAGKTVLVGAIVATEFAMALEYPDSEDPRFVENALVFAPGKTIIESLRELARIPYERLLPPRLLRPFSAALKLTFTRDGDPDIPVVRGSSFNLVVTNTEKIRIQARPTRRRTDALLLGAIEEQAREDANRRLQAIASLPHLAVFSDEAHHTYGNRLGADLKRVRQTVDYLAERSPNLMCVVNTTGTPYFGRQPLRDVVYWYGLGQGIADGILKEVAGSVQSFAFASERAGDFVAHVVRDFVAEYRDVALPDGAPAKLAIYFPQTDDLDELRPRVELALADAGLPGTVVLAHTSKTGLDAEVAFNHLNDPAAPHRVILLVNKGTEGWNCPSLFATALARRLSSGANNFVLQAASRCLRQVPGNDRPARIYLSDDNRAILDRQLQETYGETIASLDRTVRETKKDRIRLDPRKTDVPPMILRQPRRSLRRVDAGGRDGLLLERPTAAERAALVGTVLDVGPQAATRKVLRAVGDEIVVDLPVATIDRYAAAVHFSAALRLPLDGILAELARTYPEGEVPTADLAAIQAQLEAQLGRYEPVEHDEDVVVRIVKLEGFDREPQPDGSVEYTSDISYPADRAGIVLRPEHLMKENPAAYGFHYSPYNFDSRPEASYFEQLVRALNEAEYEVADVYFTGAITAPSKTDLSFEYRRADGRPARYTPDFLVRCRDGRWLLVEVKRDSAREDAVEGLRGRKAEAIRAIVTRNAERLSYEPVFAAGDSVLASDLKAARDFARTCGAPEPA